MDSLVSVIIPAYNHECYVQDSIRSAMDQTYANLELIVINDGSSDSTHEKILELSEACKNRFVRYEYVTRPNRGISYTFNEALNMAEGTYLFHIASDDMARPNAIEVLKQLIESKPNVAAAVGDNELIDDKGNRTHWGKGRRVKSDGRNGVSTINEMIIRDTGNPVFFQTDFGTYRSFLDGCLIGNGVLYRRDALIAVGGYHPELRVEDWYIHLQLSKQYDYVATDEILFRYRWHGNNTMNSPEVWATNKILMENEKAYCDSHGLSEVWKKKMVQHVPPTLPLNQKVLKVLVNLIPVRAYRHRMREKLREACARKTGLID